MIISKSNFFYLKLRNIYYFFRLLPFKISIIYEKKISLFLFYILRPLIFFLEKILEKFNILFIINVSPGVGHLIEEFDYLNKYYKKNKSYLKKKKIIWITKKEKNFIELYNEYKKEFSFLKVFFSNYLFYFALPIMFSNNHKILLDIGSGQQSYNPSDRKIAFNYTSIINTGLRMKDKEDYLKKVVTLKDDYLSKGRSFLNTIKENKQHFIYKVKKLNIDKKKKTILIHINDRKINQNAEPLKPRTYLKLFNYLKNNDYQIILVGREEYPKIFSKFNVIDYANSEYASLVNDIRLFKIADYSIICASGLYFIPYLLRKKFLYINNWNFQQNLGNKKSLVWPSILYTNKGKLNFKKQVNLFMKSLSLNHSRIPNRYKIRNINNNELLNSFKFLELKKIKKNKYQKLFKSFHIIKSPMFLSEEFIFKNKRLLK